MDWPLTRYVELQARRMHDVIDKLGIDRGTFVRMRKGEAYHEARSRCLECRHVYECRRWLDTTERFADTPDFCPNYEIFDACVPLEQKERRICKS